MLVVQEYLQKCLCRQFCGDQVGIKMNIERYIQLGKEKKGEGETEVIKKGFARNSAP